MQPAVGGVGGRGCQVTQYVWHLGQEFLSNDDRDVATIIVAAYKLPPNHCAWNVLYEAIPDWF